MRIELSLDLPLPLIEELDKAARECRVHPTLFCAEAIESTLASRRISFMPRGRLGARMIVGDDEF